MKIAIIGATSFVGRNLMAQLLRKKINIIATYKSNKEIKKTHKVTWKKLDVE